MNQENILNPAWNRNRRRGADKEQNLGFISVSLKMQLGRLPHRKIFINASGILTVLLRNKVYSQEVSLQHLVMENHILLVHALESVPNIVLILLEV